MQVYGKEKCEKNACLDSQLTYGHILWLQKIYD